MVTTWRFQPSPQLLGLTSRFISMILHIWFQHQMKESPDLWHILLTMYVVVTVIPNGSALWKCLCTNTRDRLGSTTHQYETLMDHILGFRMFGRRHSPRKTMPRTRLQRPKFLMFCHG